MRFASERCARRSEPLSRSERASLYPTAFASALGWPERRRISARRTIASPNRTRPADEFPGPKSGRSSIPCLVARGSSISEPAMDDTRRSSQTQATALVSVWAREQPRFQSRPAASAVDGDVEVPWTMPDKTVVPRFYHLFQKGELERLIIGSGLHGERFFPGAGNWFAQARSNG